MHQSNMADALAVVVSVNRFQQWRMHQLFESLREAAETESLVHCYTLENTLYKLP